MGEITNVGDEALYVIRVKGLLEEKWSNWFDQFVILPQENGESLLYGSVVDQAALYGLLAKIRDLCLPLLLVKMVSEEEFLAIQKDYQGKMLEGQRARDAHQR